MRNDEKNTEQWASNTETMGEKERWSSKTEGNDQPKTQTCLKLSVHCQ